MVAAIVGVVFALALITSNVEASAQAFKASEGFLSWDSSPSHYEVVVPKLLLGEKKHRATILGLMGRHPERVRYAVQVGKREVVLNLERNRYLNWGNFSLSFQNGSSSGIGMKTMDHCYYHGEVESEALSTVAFSTCFGLRGVFTLDGVSYALEPMEEGKHLLYRLENLKLNGSVCGVSSDKHIFVETDSPVSFLLRRKRALLVDTRYVELLLVVENKMFVQLYQEDHQKLIAALAELTNTMDAHFKPLNVRVIPVDGVILSAGEDEVVIGQRESAGAVLGRFVTWRQNNITKLKRNDAALLMTEKIGTTLGMAFVGTVCSDSNSGGIATLHTNVMIRAAIASHELGHVLGIRHDGSECSSHSGPYIMSAALGGTVPTKFSSCSENTLENLLVVKKSGSCLRNQPVAGEGLRPQECGNNMLEVGEECDCGKPENCSNHCCNASSCKLKKGSQCASGLCCKNCKFIPQGFQCRPSTVECDFPEYCDGLSSTCPSHTFAQNGQPCANNSAYCYGGVCQTLNKQCQDIWGGEAKAASDACFEKVNTKGNEFGNCGQQGRYYTACAKRNAKCGKLICSNTPISPLIPEDFWNS
uniref:Uncharacterized protein n=1 Tax=Eptatretus burgeri TaxID=7764 RepID=A0A8C4Q999_EPTBU